MFIIFILLDFLCIWVSIFHVFCRRSLLLFVHASKLPDEVWQENEAEIFWDLRVRSWALVCLRSKRLLSHKKFQSLVGKSFQGWNTGFGLYPYRIFFWIWRFPSFVSMQYLGTGLTRLAQLDVDPVGTAWSASNSSRYSRGDAWNSAQCSAVILPSCTALNAQLSVTVPKCNRHHLPWWEIVQLASPALSMNYGFFKVGIIQSKNAV